MYLFSLDQSIQSVGQVLVLFHPGYDLHCSPYCSVRVQQDWSATTLTTLGTTFGTVLAALCHLMTPGMTNSSEQQAEKFKRGLTIRLGHNTGPDGAVAKSYTMAGR